MLNFKYINWENFFELSPDRLNVLVVENKHRLYSYLQELLKGAEGEPSNFILFDERHNQQSISKICVVEANVVGITLNSKKLITALYKKCGSLATEPESEYLFRKRIKELFDLCREISLDVGYDTILKEIWDPSDVFKLFGLEIKEHYNTLLEKLVAYINANIELLKTKIFIFLFLTKFLNNEELQILFRHCECQGVFIVLIEDAVLDEEYLKEIAHQTLIIDNDSCEIFRE